VPNYNVPVYIISPQAGLGLTLPILSSGVVLDTALAQLRPVYLQQVQRARPWLEAQGRNAGRALLLSAGNALPGRTPPPRDTPQWIVEWVDPIVDPVLHGLRQELAPTLQSVGIGVGAGALFALVLAFMVGRATNR